MVGRRPGVAPQTERREAFARLIARGVPNAEACRIVGINRRTGRAWRYGREITSSSGVRLRYPPMINASKLKISDRYLSEEERIRLADLRQAGLGVRAIAAELGRGPSTISREPDRNHDPSTGQYRPFTAHRLAAQRRARPPYGRSTGRSWAGLERELPGRVLRTGRLRRKPPPP